MMNSTIPKLTLSNQKVLSLKTITTNEMIKINNSNIIKEKKMNVEDKYQIIKLLGKGSFGSVYQIIDKSNGLVRAMKTINKENIKYQDDSRTFLKEIEILIAIDHPNIIRIFEYFSDDLNYYLITEYFSGGELYDSIIKWNALNERKAAFIIKQLLSAVLYLHSKSIVHRDIKPENILVVSDPKDKTNIQIKLIDFGTCNYIEKDNFLKLKIGTPYYMAPEVIKKNYNEKCDIWSVGVILYILLAGYPPFIGKDSQQIFQSVLKGEFSLDSVEWKSISQKAKDLVSNMLKYDYSIRYSAEDCMNDDWIKSFNFEEKNSIKAKLSSALVNMKNFQCGEKLQQATIAFIVHNITNSKEIDNLKKVFSVLDKNGDGRLTYNEIRNGFESVFGVHLTQLELYNIVKFIDQDRDGYIGYEEFLRVTMDYRAVLKTDNLKTAFQEFDSNKDGKLSIDELKNVLGTTDSHYILELLKQIDLNGDGEICFEEFCHLMGAVKIGKNIM